jgi:MFS family permease
MKIGPKMSTFRNVIYLLVLIASIHSLASPIGSLVSAPIMDAYGRKNTLLFSIIPLLSGWSIIALSESHMAILAGRVVCGLAVGLMGAPAQVRL